jgi:hypothetical protein
MNVRLDRTDEAKAEGLKNGEVAVDRLQNGIQQDRF